MPVGASLIVVSSFFYASYGIWTKLMGDYFDGFTASALRSVLVVAILLVITACTHAFEPLLIRKNWPYIVGMVISSLFVWGPLYYAIQEAGVGISLAIAYTCTVLGSLLFGGLLGKEQLTKTKLIAATLGIVGLGVIFLPDMHGTAWLPLAGAAVSGFSSAGVMVLAKYITYNGTQATLVLWVTSIIANCIMAVVLRRPWPTLGLHIEWLYLVLFAIASVIASWSYVRGLKLIDAGTAGILGLLEIVFGVLFGVLLFGEHLEPIVLLGIGIVIVAAAIPYIATERTNTRF